MTDSNPQQIRSSRITFKTKKKFAWVLLFIDDAQSARHKQESKETSTIVFYLPQSWDLTSSSQLSLRLLYRHSWSMHTKTIVVPFRDMVPPVGEGKQEWRRLYGRSCELVVELGKNSEGQYAMEGNDHPQGSLSAPSGVHELRPTTDQILEKCPHFRILVIGRTGAGKSSLINKIFRVGPSDQQAHVSHDRPGEADIDTEIKSTSNPQFILHDSLGFEHGETEHFNKVLNFIQDRNKKTDIKEKLHAVWICLQIPIMGGRLLETGVERLLQLKKEGELGKVPVIVVFTKYDMLCDSVQDSLYDQEPNPERLIQETKRHAHKKLIEELIDPFEKDVGHEVLHVTVSTSPEPDYEQMLQNLVQITFNTVYAYVAEASLATAIAQKVDPDVKISAIIDVGRRQYWRGLASSLKFPSYTLECCLEVIHTDIIKVWSFNDPNKLLLSAQFRALMANGVDVKIEGSDPTKTLSVGLSMVAALGGILSALAGPAAPIVIPIAAAFVFAVWAREVYVASQATLRRIMTYIIDLTAVTQNIFWILGSDPRPITRRLIKLAFRTHISSDKRNQLLVEIADYSKEGIGHTGADTTFDKILELIKASTINSEEMFVSKQNLNLNTLWAQGDEDWDTPDLSSMAKPTSS